MPRQLKTSGQHKNAVRFVVIYFSIMLVSLSASVLFGLSGLMKYFDLNGYLSCFCSCLQYFPLILQVWQTKNVASISKSTLIMQIVGSILLIILLSIGKSTSVSNWISYAVCGSFQVALLSMCILYKERKVKPDNDGKI